MCWSKSISRSMVIIQRSGAITGSHMSAFLDSYSLLFTSRLILLNFHSSIDSFVDLTMRLTHPLVVYRVQLHLLKVMCA